MQNKSCRNENVKWMSGNILGDRIRKDMNVSKNLTSMLHGHGHSNIYMTRGHVTIF